MFLAVTCIAALAPLSSAADIWVSGSGSDFFPNDGSSVLPFRTINRAMQEANANDTIKVLSGDYGVADGEVFPIVIKAGVDILGQEAEEEDLPRIGGDVEDGSVRALFEVVAASADRVDILISGLRFVGEDTENEDAPSALYVENRDGYKAIVAIEHCIVERSRMNESGSAGRAAIVGVAGAGHYPENAPDPIVSLALSAFMCTIAPTDGGGVNIDVSANATPEAQARPHLVVSRSSFTLTGGETAPTAIDMSFRAYGDDESARAVDATCELLLNTIDARACTGTGIAEGIVLGGDARHGGVINFEKNGVRVVANDIRGTTVAGIRYHAFSDDGNASLAAVRSWHTERNVIMDGLGDGLVVRKDADSEHVYFNFRFKGNLIADNAWSALLFEGIEELSGDATVTCNTLAGNGRYGVEFDDSPQSEFLDNFQNNIVWGNALGSALDWDWTASQVVFTHNDFEDLFETSSCTPDGDDNMDADPGFVNAGAGNYHLLATSCMIAKGTSSPVSGLPELDIDAQDRVYGARVDVGADEYHP